MSYDVGSELTKHTGHYTQTDSFFVAAIFEITILKLFVCTYCLIAITQISYVYKRRYLKSKTYLPRLHLIIKLT